MNSVENKILIYLDERIITMHNRKNTVHDSNSRDLLETEIAEAETIRVHVNKIIATEKNDTCPGKENEGQERKSSTGGFYKFIVVPGIMAAFVWSFLDDYVRYAEAIKADYGIVFIVIFISYLVGYAMKESEI
jgi:hypothetical protein